MTETAPRLLVVDDSLENLKTDVHVIAATNRNLRAELMAGRFRADFFYRLSIIEIHLVPLREHREDIPYLTARFVQECAARLKRSIGGVTRRASVAAGVVARERP
jgi:transcriptional regulator with GAF, ATPase, and Fis domain